MAGRGQGVDSVFGSIKLNGGVLYAHKPCKMGRGPIIKDNYVMSFLFSYNGSNFAFLVSARG